MNNLNIYQNFEIKKINISRFVTFISKCSHDNMAGWNAIFELGSQFSE